MQRSNQSSINKFSINHDGSDESTPLMSGNKTRPNYSVADAARPSEELDRITIMEEGHANHAARPSEELDRIMEMEEGRANHLTSKMDDSYPDDKDDNEEEKILLISPTETTTTTINANNTDNTSKTEHHNPLSSFKEVKFPYNNILDAIKLVETELSVQKKCSVDCAYLPKPTSAPGITLTTLFTIASLSSLYFTIKSLINVINTYNVTEYDLDNYNSCIVPVYNQTCGQEYPVYTGAQLCGNEAIFKNIHGCINNNFCLDCWDYAELICRETWRPEGKKTIELLSSMIPATISMIILCLYLLYANSIKKHVLANYFTFQNLSTNTQNIIAPILTYHEVTYTQATEIRELLVELRKIHVKELNNLSELKAFQRDIFNDEKSYLHYLKFGRKISPEFFQMPAGPDVMNMTITYVDGCDPSEVKKPTFFSRIFKKAAYTLSPNNDLIKQAFHTR